MNLEERRRVEASVHLRAAARLIAKADANLVSVGVWEFEGDLDTARTLVLRASQADKDTKYH